jgi:hypothetical protein
MTGKKWRFTNSARPSEFIVVHDEVSARNLGRLLEMASAEKWTVSEEVYSSTVEADLRPPVQNRGSVERRKQKRFSASFRVIIVSGKSSFRTTSVDISAGGMLLRDKLPEAFLNQKCVAYISSNDSRENLEMVCEIVGEKADLRRISFKSVEPPSLKKLGDWLENDMAA